MINVKFTDDLLTGFKPVDEQHKAIFRKLEVVLEATIEGRLMSETEELLTFLGDYVDHHFRTEEALMERFHFRDYGCHKAQHDRFRAKTVKSISEFKKESANQTLILDIVKSIHDWLISHIGKEDKELGHFIKAARKDDNI